MAQRGRRPPRSQLLSALPFGPSGRSQGSSALRDAGLIRCAARWRGPRTEFGCKAAGGALRMSAANPNLPMLESVVTALGTAMDLLLKPNDQAGKLAQFGVDQIDTHVPERFTRAELE